MSDAALGPGAVVAGKYQVERVLGEGGMGLVVAARHLQLDEMVAIKVARTGALTPAMRDRFLREARAVTKLKSEHVARVRDVGELESGEPYIVMEYLEGRDLAEELARKARLPAQLAVYYVLQACVGLAEAHRVGIVHRDLKPQNLFLTRRVDGTPLVKVLDFGVSKIDVASGAHDGKMLTGGDAVLGTPHYMSPEQLRTSREVDERSDVWALGVILYELITGRVPFDAPAVTELAAKILEDEPTPIETLAANLPDGLAAVVHRCLAKSRDVRYRTVAELADALDPYSEVHSRRGAGHVRAVAEARDVRPSDVPPQLTASLAETELATSSPTNRSRRGAVAVLGLAVLGGLSWAAQFQRALAPAEPPASSAPTAPRTASTTGATSAAPPEPTTTASAPSAASATTSASGATSVPATASAPSARPPRTVTPVRAPPETHARDAARVDVEAPSERH